ncbi:hypothetical protein AWV80_33085 [Cupriavidus sp. UYMU48A]|nr:hypothetical protein AWV80_33085 [Cupriavidus sp. UYMU48A]
MALTKGLVACKRGCSACCHSEIALYQPEADLIAAKTGLPVRQIPRDPARRSTPYATTKAPCPFLHDGACSIYAHRPLVCRTMVNFDADSTVCQFEHRDNTPVPMIDRASSFTGVFEAYYNVIVRRNGGGRWATFANSLAR